MKKYLQRFLCIFLVLSFFIFPFAKRKVYAASGPTDPLVIEKLLFFVVMAGGLTSSIGCSQQESSARLTISWQAFKDSLTTTPPPPWFTDYINARKGFNILAWTITKEEFTKLYNYFRGCITKGNKKSVSATTPAGSANVPASFNCQYPSYDNTDIINYFEKGSFSSPFEITYTTYPLYMSKSTVPGASLSTVFNTNYTYNSLLTVIVIRSSVFCRIIFKNYSAAGTVYFDSLSSDYGITYSNGNTNVGKTDFFLASLDSNYFSTALSGRCVFIDNGYSDYSSLENAKNYSHLSTSFADFSKVLGLTGSGYIVNASSLSIDQAKAGTTVPSSAINMPSLTDTSSEKDVIYPSVVSNNSAVGTNTATTTQHIDYVPIDTDPADTATDTDSGVLGWLENAWTDVKSIPSAIQSFEKSWEDFWHPDWTKLDFSPLEVSFKDKFPFCIPFDFVNCFKSFTTSEAAPPKWDISFPAIYGLQDVKATIDLSFLENGSIKPALVLRYFILVFFCVNLAKITRNLIRG